MTVAGTIKTITMTGTATRNRINRSIIASITITTTGMRITGTTKGGIRRSGTTSTIVANMAMTDELMVRVGIDMEITSIDMRVIAMAIARVIEMAVAVGSHRLTWHERRDIFADRALGLYPRSIFLVFRSWLA